jgi:RNA polymerase sigma-70 factor, ECF subfamily
VTPPPPTDTATAGPTPEERELLEAARGGNEDAFARLVEPRRGELHAHCYRMLGSTHDAEDALQEAMLRAWKGLAGFDGRSSLRPWLYRIATNTCLDAIAKRPKRVLPVDYGPAADPHETPGQPLVESVWIEPYPDETLQVEDGLAGPEARYEQREALELAFIAALQFLPANQRAVLVMREVLGFSAKETAEALDTSVASVNSALQRARKTIDEKTPEESQQETLRQLGDDKVTEIVETYIKAWEDNDIDTVVSLLSDDVAFTMPPMSTWYTGLEETRIWMENSSMTGEWGWRAVRARANGQEALAFYSIDTEQGKHVAFALNVLTFKGDKLSEVDCFINRTIEDPGEEAMGSFPNQELDERAAAATFERFGLPLTLD